MSASCIHCLGTGQRGKLSTWNWTEDFFWFLLLGLVTIITVPIVIITSPISLLGFGIYKLMNMWDNRKEAGQ